MLRRQSDYPIYTLTSSARGDGPGGGYPTGTAYADERARFFEPHAVHLTSAGKVLLIDDGKERANCTEVATCYSRAVQYELNHNHQVVIAETTRERRRLARRRAPTGATGRGRSACEETSPRPPARGARRLSNAFVRL